MLYLFKDKQKTYNAGIIKGRIEERNRMNKKIDELRTAFNKKLAEKNAEIKWRDKYINDVQKEIEIKQDSINEVEYVTQLAVDEEFPRFRDASEVLQRKQKLAAMVSSAKRRLNMSAIEEKIEKYNIKKMG
jgi:hypothetical protein